MGCFWGAEKKFWEHSGRLLDRGRLRRRLHAEPDLSGGLQRHDRATTRQCWWYSTPQKVSYDALLKTFWESHNPTQGMRQGNDAGTQYRSGIYYFDEAQRAAAEHIADAYQQEL